MSRNTALFIIIWNVVLTALLAWSLLRSPGNPSTAVAGTDGTELAETVPMPTVARDSSVLKEARIAYFRMDSLQKRFELIKEKDDRFRVEGQRLESTLQNEVARSQKRYNELMTKDHTYSTQEEVRRDEEEVQQLARKLQELQARSEEQLARLEAAMLQEISDELKTFLEAYNEQAGFDYIFSVQNGGQVWVGNEDLDITTELVDGLNARHRARKASAKK